MARPSRPAVISAEQLEKIGRLLYGDQWVSALARELGMSRRNLQYLAEGAQPVHAGIVEDLVGVISERTKKLDAIAEELADELAGLGYIAP